MLFASGYSADSFARRVDLPAEVDLIEKPYEPEQLLTRVREALDRTVAESRVIGGVPMARVRAAGPTDPAAAVRSAAPEGTSGRVAVRFGPCTIHGPSTDQVPGRPARPMGVRRRRASSGEERMPKVAGSVKELLAALDGIARIEGDRLVVVDEDGLRTRGIYDLAWTATFSEDEATVEAARWIVWEASQAVGARSASIQELYKARSRGEYEGMTVPAINLRAQTFDMARVILETARKNDSAAVIFELARSEQTYTFQRVFEYATSVLAGAIAAGWKGPVFIQGDHYQFNAKKYAADAEKMTEEIRKACRDAIAAGYRNIDIDSSTLVDLSHATLDAQQHENYMRAAELTALIRSLEVDGVTVSVGGEIGEVGKKNSTPDELKAYLDGYRRELDARAKGAIGLSKVSVQTGTSHGGTPLPGGGVAEVALDFNVLTELSVVAREYGLSGAVQHGA